MQREIDLEIIVLFFLFLIWGGGGWTGWSGRGEEQPCQQSPHPGGQREKAISGPFKFCLAQIFMSLV